jgi:hypothetical protein
MRKLGWMTDEAASRYAQALKGTDFGDLPKQAEQDLKQERITTEAFWLIQTLR